ncbi:sensor histidine kinase [Clostridium akagii]|uniref:sensor histidine kinase n=1 Tax=Clostridium akagii TaxID=91623 RepID=UPI00047B6363|nr:HAMP domain-containing sensor histidine kinase [Clostridium akagii]
MLEKKPLRTQFRIIFILIIVTSIMATIVTYCTGFVIYGIIQYKKMYPSNYYEKKIPDIKNYIRKYGIVILNPKEKISLDKVIPTQGMKYQVLDENAHIIYGTGYKIINSKEELYTKINTDISIGNEYIKIIHILDSEGKAAGAVSLSYTLKNHYMSSLDKIWIIPLYIVIIFSPFIYIAVFTGVFSKKFERNISKPVNMLIDASKKIEQKDLDFNIDYSADNELGKLCQGFNEMKSELKDSLRAQWRIEQERQEMVEALAHDLKTPFSIIKGYVESLLDGNYKEEQKLIKYLNVIDENTNRGSELIKEMLYAAELESQDIEICTTELDIYSFMKRKKENYEMLRGDKNIEFKLNINIEKNDKKTYSVDAYKLERILDNIIFNSIRYTPENGQITINVDKYYESIKFTIQNTGKEFSSKDLSSLFNKFYKGDGSRNSKNGNAGLGLYIVKKLVEIQGGSIRAFNSESGGACIEFVL